MIDDIINYIDNLIINLNKKKRTILAISIRIFHMIITYVFIILYILFAPITFDFYLSLIMLLQSLHWLFLKCECIFSYIEKKLININYKLGEDPSHDIFNQTFTLILDFIVLIIILILFNRNKNITKVIIILILIITIYVNIWKFFCKKINS